MKITGLIQDRSQEIEQRKRIQQRKEAGDAYRKNSQYFQYEKNPALTELERLLTGEKDFSEYEKQKEEKQKEDAPEVKAAVQELKQAEQNVMAHEQAHMSVGGAAVGSASYSYTEGPDGKKYITGGEVPISPPATSTTEDMIAVLEQVRRAALAPADPSPQDLRVAASATAQIQQTKGQQATESSDETTTNEVVTSETSEPTFLNEKVEVTVPERFNKEFDALNAQQETVFGKSYEDVYRKKLYNIAKDRYATHTQMVKNGYRSGVDPQFSLIA